MEPQIRPIRQSEHPLLEDLLYEAIWQPDAALRLPREVIRRPELSVYVEAFGERAGDCCLVAEVDGRVAGAAWSRVMHGFGSIDEETPELAVALFPDFRGRESAHGLSERCSMSCAGGGMRPCRSPYSGPIPPQGSIRGWDSGWSRSAARSW